MEDATVPVVEGRYRTNGRSMGRIFFFKACYSWGSRCFLNFLLGLAFPLVTLRWRWGCFSSFFVFLFFPSFLVVSLFIYFISCVMF